MRGQLSWASSFFKKGKYKEELRVMNIIKNAMDYMANRRSKSDYLDECFEIMNNKNKFLDNLNEDDVIKINNELTHFFEKNINNHTVSYLSLNYQHLKKDWRKYQELEKTKCTERNKKKFEKELDNERWQLENLNENREAILKENHLTEIEWSSAISKVTRRIKRLENILEDIDNYCENHGNEKGFGEIVIKKMNMLIKEQQKNTL